MEAMIALLLPKEFKNLIISLNKIAGFWPASGNAAFLKMGSLRSTPNTNTKKMLAGVFCLNKPIT